MAAAAFTIHAAALVLQTQDDVLRGGEDVHQLEVLVDHADAAVKGVLGGGDGHRLAVDIDLPLVGEVDAGEHVHQRGLAAAVLPQQGQDLALVQLKVDVVVGHHAAEALGDVLHSDGVPYRLQGCHPFFAGGRRGSPLLRDMRKRFKILYCSTRGKACKSNSTEKF